MEYSVEQEFKKVWRVLKCKANCGSNNLSGVYILPKYINDAAADADTNLLSGQLYKLINDRIVYQKP